MKATWRGLVAAAAVLAIVVLGMGAWFSITRQYDVNLVSGVWLTLARDLCDGLFYRDLITPSGYGGTRYFPLFFVLIAAFMRAGLDPVGAGHAASFLGAGVLVTGAWAFARQLGLQRDAAGTLAVLVATPYVVQQSTFAIRVEPLAAGLALWGLTAVVAMEPPASWRTTGVAAAWFTLATAAKPTSVWAPAAATMALALARRRADAARLASLTGLGLLILVAGVELLSEGRFLRSLQAVALAGRSAHALLTPRLVLDPIALVATSHLLSVLFLLTTASLVTCGSDWRHLPALAVGTSAAATVVVLATPGTILTNQSVEPCAAAIIFLGWYAHRRPTPSRFVPPVLTGLLLWTSAQNVLRLEQSRQHGEGRSLPDLRPALIAALQTCHGPVLAESPLVPLVAGQSPVLLDPFAFRVAALRFPRLAEDLGERASERHFACVVLEHNPDEAQGANWYRHVDFGQGVIEAILRNYEYRESVGPHRFYHARP